jgi:hypothetical protein
LAEEETDERLLRGDTLMNFANLISPDLATLDLREIKLFVTYDIVSYYRSQSYDFWIYS